jgi:RNA recognition motif-containing protein
LAQKGVHLGKSLYVGNLASPDGQSLKALLSRFGVVRHAAVAPGDGAPHGGGYYGVVEMQSEDDALNAIRALDGFEVAGARLAVRWATPAEQTSCGHPGRGNGMAPDAELRAHLVQALMEIRHASEQLAAKCQGLYKHVDEVLHELRQVDDTAAATPRRTARQ